MANTIKGVITILTLGVMLAGDGTAGLDGTPGLFMVAVPTATSAVMILASDGIRAPITYRLMQHRNRRGDGGATTLSFRTESELGASRRRSSLSCSEPRRSVNRNLGQATQIR